MLHKSRTVFVLLVAFFAPLVCVAQTLTWTQKCSSCGPHPSSFGNMAYDEARGEILLFGGYDPNTNVVFDETWAWDGSNWNQRFPATKPPARTAFAMAYDAARGQIVIFGGAVGASASGAQITNETWIWDGTTWTEKHPVTSPSPRLHGTMVFDPVIQGILLIGGSDGSSNSFQETWLWDGANWTMIASPPLPRISFGATYDSTRGQTVVFGGGQCGSLDCSFWTDTEFFDGTAWIASTPSPSPSTPRQGHRLAFDALRRHVVLFGGAGPGNAPTFNDTWRWDGSSWMQEVPDTSPAPRSFYSMAYDTVRSEVVLFGGADGAAALGDTWVLVPNGFLNFPVSSDGSCLGGVCSPSTAPIVAVFDHSMKTSYECRPATDSGWGTVMDFRGESAGGIANVSGHPGAGACKRLYGYKSGGQEFLSDVHYVGVESESGNRALQYDSHPGYDYAFPFGTPVQAAVSGCVSYSKDAPGENAVGFHVLTIIPSEVEPSGGCANATSSSGYYVFYLHLASFGEMNVVKRSLTPDGAVIVTCFAADGWAQPGTWVRANQTIGYTGNYSNGWYDSAHCAHGLHCGVRPHLHFEVGLERNGEVRPVDPYGWHPIDQSKADPYANFNPGFVNRTLWKSIWP